MKLFWNSRKEEIRMAESQKNQTEKENIVELKTNIYLLSIIGEVEGKHVILLDDMVDTGGSLCNAAKALIEVGGAKSVQACASHGVLSGPAVERIEKSVLKEVYFLDTVPPKAGVACDKIKYLSVAHMFAEAIERIYQEISIAKLFN